MARPHPSQRKTHSRGTVAAKRAAVSPLQPGSAAPDFEPHGTPDQKPRLSDFRTRTVVVLAFYPTDSSPVCGDELALFNELLPEFGKRNAQLMGISVNGAWCHEAYARDRKLHSPLPADYEPKGAVSKTFGVYNVHEGHSDRALFVIDGAEILRRSYVSPEGVSPGANGMLRALDAIGEEEDTTDA